MPVRKGGTTAPVLTLRSRLSVAGSSMKITFQYSVVSSYSNGNPWSVTLGNTVLVGGGGASLSWSQFSREVVCGPTESSNTLAFRLQSNANRAASLLVADVTVTLL